MTTLDQSTDADTSGGVSRASTATRGTRVLGVLTLLAMAWLVLFGLVLSPADVNQGESVRFFYIHAPTIWVAYTSFIVTAVASGFYLFTKKHSLGWDRLAGASAEIGVVFVALTLLTGMLWGRLTWGVFWQWDARLTTTSLLFVTYIGYLAVRRLGGSHQQRAKRSAVIGLLSVLLIPLVHWSVVIWRSLHQEATVLDTDLDPDIDGLMFFTILVGVVAFSLFYAWFLLHRTRVMFMEDLLEDQGLDRAVEARRAEAAETMPAADAMPAARPVTGAEAAPRTNPSTEGEAD